MRLLHIFRQRVRSLFRGGHADAELARELEFHLEELVRENIAAGMVPGAARSAARRALGGVAQIEQQCRDHRRVAWLTEPMRDLGYAWRTLARTPVFTALAAVTLALGVGATISVYALGEALLLRSLPYAEPERLVRLVSEYLPTGAVGAPVVQENFRDWRASSTAFDGMVLTQLAEATLTGGGEAERIQGLAVSEGFFELLGVQHALGRWFDPDEQPPGSACAVMLSHALWARKLGARPESVGTDIVLDDQLCRVTGVMPQNFRFNDPHGGVAEYWTPIQQVWHSRAALCCSAYGRLRPRVSLEAAQAEMSQIAGRLAEAYPENAVWGVRVRGMRAELLEQVGDELLLFAAAALMVLLVACANVASFLMARGIGRSREIAVRMALGARRGRVVRLLLAESLLLAGLSAVAGVLLAAWLLKAAIAAAPAWMQLGDAVSVSPWLALFAVGLTLCTGLLAGLWPALRGSRTALEGDLRESGGALVAGRRQLHSLHALVVMEVALAVVLLTFAGLLTQSFQRLLETDLGYRTDRLLTFQMPLPTSRYGTDAARLAFWDALLPQLAAVPGVLSVAASDSIPLSGTYGGGPVEVEGRARSQDARDMHARAALVTPDYFRTMGMPVVLGEGFRADGSDGDERVVVVNEAFVRAMLPEDPPVGARVRIGGAPWARVVGVVADGRYNGPTQSPSPEVYMPHRVFPRLQFVAIHTAVSEQGVLDGVREIIQRLDPELPMAQVGTMRQSVDRSISMQRQMMALLAAFGVVTLAMAALGLSGVMLYTVSRRRREIGLRIALGARPVDVARNVGAAARLVAAGSSLGVLAALASGRVLESLLYGVERYDPAALAAPAVLAVVALAACLVPFRRALTVEPMDALREG